MRKKRSRNRFEPFQERNKEYVLTKSLKFEVPTLRELIAEVDDQISEGVHIKAKEVVCSACGVPTKIPVNLTAGTITCHACGESVSLDTARPVSPAPYTFKMVSEDFKRPSAPKMSDVGSKPVLSHECLECGYTIKYVDTLVGLKCLRCGFPADKEIDIIIDRLADDETPTGKHQYRWFCKSCHTKGIAWRSRAESPSKIACASCGATGRGRINVTKIASSGSCDDVWGQWTPPLSRPSPPRTKWVCPSCGYVIRYLTKKPSGCPDCGWNPALAAELAHFG